MPQDILSFALGDSEPIHAWYTNTLKIHPQIGELATKKLILEQGPHDLTFK